jgi:hypothetical protein
MILPSAVVDGVADDRAVLPMMPPNAGQTALLSAIARQAALLHSDENGIQTRVRISSTGCQEHHPINPRPAAALGRSIPTQTQRSTRAAAAQVSVGARRRAGRVGWTHKRRERDPMPRSAPLHQPPSHPTAPDTCVHPKLTTPPNQLFKRKKKRKTQTRFYPL